jgi:hypothetical protein
MNVFYMHPDHIRRPIWKRIWLRLCPYIVDGGSVGVHGFLTRTHAVDFFYQASNRNETNAPINIQRKRIGAKMDAI